VTNRGRIVIFFIDDLHLALASLVRTRQALTEFIDHGMSDNDQVAITSSSGQIGFLQQFTDDRTALHSAVARLNLQANPKFEAEKPPMSEYIALRIREGDEAALNYYVSEMQKQTCTRSGGCPVGVPGDAVFGTRARTANNRFYGARRRQYPHHA
jgi:hypothetical protein